MHRSSTGICKSDITVDLMVKASIKENDYKYEQCIISGPFVLLLEVLY